MHPAQWRIFFASLLLSVLAVSCSPGSKHPLSQPGEFPNDNRLTGAWFMGGEEGHMVLHISVPKKGLLDLIVVSQEHKGGGEAIQYKVHTTPVGDNHFMNINIVGKDEQKGLGPEARYLIAYYKIRDDKELEFHFMEMKKVTQDVQDEKVKGFVKEQQFMGKPAIITASSKELVEYIQQSDLTTLFGNEMFEEVLKEHGPLVKITLPAPKKKSNVIQAVPVPPRKTVDP